MTKTYFISTTIPYVNAQPHVGHAQEFVLADALARQLRQKGASVHLQSGTDDNAFKNVLSAQALGIEARQFVDTNAQKFLELQQALGVHADSFVRTSSKEHATKVRGFLTRLRTEDLYQNAYTGLYCQGCEDFFESSELVNGVCPDHQKAPENIKEQNIFFRLSRYQNEIKRLIESDQILIRPSFHKKEILNFINKGLVDISLSRSSLRSGGWGIPFPNHEDQVVYVWIDALINYWSAQWTEDCFKIHVIGKNVWKFHAIYWVGLLLSAGLPLPNQILIHGFLTNEGVKISKSLKNGGDPSEYVKRYGSDALRFYLLRTLQFQDDADFSESHLKATYNAELANKLGNLVSRVIALCGRSGFVPIAGDPAELTTTEDFVENAKRAYEIIGETNAQINAAKPWELLRNSDQKQLHEYLQAWWTDLKQIQFLLIPVIPEACEWFAKILSCDRREPLFPRR